MPTARRKPVSAFAISLVAMTAAIVGVVAISAFPDHPLMPALAFFGCGTVFAVAVWLRMGAKRK